MPLQLTGAPGKISTFSFSLLSVRASTLPTVCSLWPEFPKGLGCLVSAFDGAFLSREWKEALWARQRDYRPRASQGPINSNFEGLLRTALLMAFVHGDFQSASSILSAAATRPKEIDKDETQKPGEVPDIASVYSRMRRLRMAQIAGVEAEILEHLASELRSRSKV